MVSTVGRLRRLALLPIALAFVWVGLAAVAVEADAASERLQLRDATGRVVERAERASLRGRQVPRARSAERREIPLLTPSPAKLRRAKARAAAELAPSPSRPQRSPRQLFPSPQATVFGGLNKAGMAANESSGTPPDTTGAIGPGHYVEFVNSVGITVYDRDLNAVSGPVSLEGFIGFPADAVFDPQIQWDQNWGRWIYVMDDIENRGTSEEENFLAVGWSKTADPTDLSTGPAGGWCGYFIETEELFDDYPKLGHGDSGITIGTNVFGPSDEFLGSRLWSISKPANPQTCPNFGEAGLSLGFTAEPLETADEDLVFTPVPANTADSSAGSYVVAADYPETLPPAPGSEIMAWHVNGGGAGATLVPDGNIEVEPYDFPANVPQEGTTEVLDSLDTRLTNAVAVTDPEVGQKAVWTQHTIDGPGGRSIVRWYELLPATQTVQQEGEIVDPQHFVFNGAISPTKRGDAAAINYNRGSATRRPEMRAQSRDSETPLGEMEGDVLLGESAGVAQDFSCDNAEEEPCRWGDYAGASPDPSVAALVWGSNQGLAAPLPSPNDEDARWTTRNFALSADSTVADVAPPAAPTITGTVPPGPANDNLPEVLGTAEVGSTVRLYRSGDCSGEEAAQDSAATFGSAGIGVLVPDNSTTQLSATATDPTGNTSPCSNTISYTEDSAPPAPPTIAGSDPASPANDNLPAFKGSAEAGSIVRLYRSSSCSGPAFAVGPAAAFGSGGLAVVVPDNQTTQVTATATDPAGNGSSCSGAFSYTEDSTPPSPPTIVGTQPPSPANDNNPKVQGSAEPGSTVRVYATGNCSGLPAATGSAAAFGSPGLGVTVLDNRTTQLSATATDAVGNTSGCSSAFPYREVTPGTLRVRTRLALFRRGRAVVPALCVGGPCRGVLNFVVRVRPRKARRSDAADSRRKGRRARNVVVARTRFRTLPRRRMRLRVPLTRAGRRLFRRAGRRALRATARGRGVAKRTLRLKNAPRKRRRR